MPYKKENFIFFPQQDYFLIICSICTCLVTAQLKLS